MKTFHAKTSRPTKIIASVIAFSFILIGKLVHSQDVEFDWAKSFGGTENDEYNMSSIGEYDLFIHKLKNTEISIVETSFTSAINAFQIQQTELYKLR